MPSSSMTARCVRPIALLIGAASALGAQAPPDTAARIDSVMREMRRLGPTRGDSIWPGYRPDTVAFLFVLPSRGAFLGGRRGALPAGFTPVPDHATLAWRDLRDLGAASTNTQLAGRPVAQVVLLHDDGPYLVSTAFHEAFHVFERVAHREGQTFGEQENAFYVSTYPVFSVDNEAGMALEGRLLGAALDVHRLAERRLRAQEFVAVRRARHARVASEIAAFDRASEMNEGSPRPRCASRPLDSQCS